MKTFQFENRTKFILTDRQNNTKIHILDMSYIIVDEDKNTLTIGAYADKELDQLRNLKEIVFDYNGSNYQRVANVLDELKQMKIDNKEGLDVYMVIANSQYLEIMKRMHSQNYKMYVNNMINGFKVNENVKLDDEKTSSILSTFPDYNPFDNDEEYESYGAVFVDVQPSHCLLKIDHVLRPDLKVDRQLIRYASIPISDKPDKKIFAFQMLNEKDKWLEEYNLELSSDDCNEIINYLDKVNLENGDNLFEISTTNGCLFTIKPYGMSKIEASFSYESLKMEVKELNDEEFEDFLVNGGFVYVRKKNEAKGIFI